LHLLAKKGKIDYRAVDGRTNEYLKSDVEAYRVKKIRKRDETKPRTSAVNKETA
jgi:hypothetical protein